MSLPLLFLRRARDDHLFLYPSVPPCYGDVFAPCGSELSLGGRKVCKPDDGLLRLA